MAGFRLNLPFKMVRLVCYADKVETLPLIPVQVRDIEKELPSDIEGYKLKRLDRQEGRIYFAFCWENEKNGWQVRALFDE